MHVSLRSTPVRHARGFTVVELMITLGVIAILMVIAVPSFSNMINSYKLTTAANDIVAAINGARLEAVKLNGYTQLCSDSSTNNTSDTLGGACNSQPGAVYSLTGSTPNPVLAPIAGLTSPVQLHGSITALRFSGIGLAYTPATNCGSPYSGTVADICNSQLKSNNHVIVTMTAGSIVSTQTSTGTCP
jgi:type IV fimbrial biogenesis protein FimT